ncbi:MAG: hypothetical protein R8N24_01720 [Alphaproteobacteria bacterium]|nr:hypothetical protein [Alphaproteobacteria bacterium]
MKKYILAFLILFIPCVTHAITMCARNDTLVGSLIPGNRNNNPTSAYSPTEPLWRATYPWGTVFGEATYLSAAEGGEPSGTSYSLTNTDGKMIPMDTLAGQVGDDANGNPREYCWCRMTHPVRSRWVFVHKGTFGAIETCQGICGLRSSSSDVLKIMFQSVFTLLADED